MTLLDGERGKKVYNFFKDTHYMRDKKKRAAGVPVFMV